MVSSTVKKMKMNNIRQYMLFEDLTDCKDCMNDCEEY